MIFNSLSNRYPSQRMTVFSRKGMVATSQPLAAEAGLEVMKKGGNAIDAAIAAAACLTVVEPTSNGIGGDAFAIVWHKNNIYGLNSSGPAPKNITIKKLKNSGYNEMPARGFIPVTVPGVPYAWRELSKRFGNISIKEALSPAISYAIEGYPVSPIVSQNWQIAFETFKKILKGEEYKEWFQTFTIDGKPPKPGSLWRSRKMGRTLIELGESECLSFYEGDIAEKIDKFSKKYNGYLNKEDLLGFSPEWVNPISINYRGYDVWELPPNTHGIVVLMALNILKNFELEYGKVSSQHIIMEAMKLAYEDGLKYITDRDKMKVSTSSLLSEDYAYERAKLIKNKSIQPKYGNPNLGGTVYLATADSEGNMVSYIQSNFMDFGSGLVVPDTGINLHNRGYSFSLDSLSTNCLKPGKKTYHTIIPGFITKRDRAIGSFGVMGKYMQPQGHVQVLTNLIDFNHNPQEALDRPRWQWIGNKEILVEPNFSEYMVKKLTELGHEIKYSEDIGSFGRGQIILREDETFIGGTESRADSNISSW